MDDLLKNKMFVVIVALTFVNLAFFIGGKLIIDKAADEVIERLERNYSPSPYGPGLDPDKVNPQALDSPRQYLEVKEELDGDPLPTSFVEQELADIAYATKWRTEWEKERGFNQ
jgi:hypothetical protein